MEVSAFGAVLLGAALHATWNGVIKGGRDVLLSMIMVTVAAGLLAAALLPACRQPDEASWPYLLVSALFQVGYFLLVVRIYRVADMSLVYPLMRGTAPLFVSAASLLWIGEHQSPLGWMGIGTICLGIIGMMADGRPGESRGVALALFNAFLIACYTLIDGIGVRSSHAPVAYTLWLFLLTTIPFATWALLAKRATFLRYLWDNWRLGTLGGMGTVASYGLALWAMTIAPVATVAALRESSILFGVIISGLVLKERLSTARVAAACAIAVGIAMIKLA